jgi:hypothetical protein
MWIDSCSRIEFRGRAGHVAGPFLFHALALAAKETAAPVPIDRFARPVGSHPTRAIAQRYRGQSNSAFQLSAGLGQTKPVAFTQKVSQRRALAMRYIAPIIGLALVLILSPAATARADDDGIVRLKSPYSMPETIKRIKKDVADKGIMFFDEIDSVLQPFHLSGCFMGVVTIFGCNSSKVLQNEPNCCGAV